MSSREEEPEANDDAIARSLAEGRSVRHGCLRLIKHNDRSVNRLVGTLSSRHAETRRRRRKRKPHVLSTCSHIYPGIYNRRTSKYELVATGQQCGSTAIPYLAKIVLSCRDNCSTVRAIWPGVIRQLTGGDRDGREIAGLYLCHAVQVSLPRTSDRDREAPAAAARISKPRPMAIKLEEGFAHAWLLLDRNVFGWLAGRR